MESTNNNKQTEGNNTNPNAQPPTKIKLIILGDQAVGKSSLLMRYCDDKFTLNMIGTAGVDFKRKNIQHNSKQYSVLFYDAAGHERFRHITKMHYQGAQGIILAYDITEVSSFNNVFNWMQNIQENADSDAEIIFIGNKIDLENREVKEKDAKALSDSFKVQLFEASAKTGEGVEKAFKTIIEKIINKTNPPKEPESQVKATPSSLPQRESVVINKENKEKKEKGACFKCS